LIVPSFNNSKTFTEGGGMLPHALTVAKPLFCATGNGYTSV